MDNVTTTERMEKYAQTADRLGEQAVRDIATAVFAYMHELRPTLPRDEARKRVAARWSLASAEAVKYLNARLDDIDAWYATGEAAVQPATASKPCGCCGK
jgi:hypothetical protein